MIHAQPRGGVIVEHALLGIQHQADEVHQAILVGVGEVRNVGQEVYDHRHRHEEQHAPQAQRQDALPGLPVTALEHGGLLSGEGAAIRQQRGALG